MRTPPLPSFRARILLSALATALLALGLTWGTSWLTMHALFPPPDHDPDPSLVDACLASPRSWDGVVVGLETLTAYDEHGRSASGRQLDLAGWPELRVGESHAVERDHHWTRATRASREGPCAWIVSEEGPPPELVLAVRWGGSLGVFLALLAASGLTWVAAIRPLMLRVERLRDAAVVVGRDGYRSASDPVPDALGDISTALDASNERIVADRVELVARHEALERYLAEIAHDLRTPIGSLLLALQEVRAEAGGPAVDRALVDADYLGSLVENLHQAARLRHGLDVGEGTADLRDVLARLEVRFAALGGARGVQVAVALPDGPVIVRCTPVLAERALANLLHNAIAHGARHVAATLAVVGEGFRIDVLDDGPGVAVPADLALRTFDDSADRPRGAGLGLAITNEIARRAGFAIRYERAEEGGLRVVLQGPRTAPG
ncbi:MAG: HAMP domain-containing histidine kinase [Myxococcales bacterium]|nr:HAMP domain-containing histidine kinase [Myxococcales bacterium]